MIHLCISEQNRKHDKVRLAALNNFRAIQVQTYPTYRVDQTQKDIQQVPVLHLTSILEQNSKNGKVSVGALIKFKARTCPVLPHQVDQAEKGAQQLPILRLKSVRMTYGSKCSPILPQWVHPTFVGVNFPSFCTKKPTSGRPRL